MGRHSRTRRGTAHRNRPSVTPGDGTPPGSVPRGGLRRRTPLTRAFLAVLATAGVLAGACSPGGEGEDAAPAGDDGAPPAAESAETTEPAGPEPVEVTSDADLYAVPDPLPAGRHGALLKYQRLDGLVPGATSYRVMYLSESLQGEPIVVTGQIVVPEGPAPAGGRPVLASAHGTTGSADQCAPSKNPPVSEVARLGPAAVANGWVLAATDYEGMGTPGRHPYLVGESEGRGVIDSVRAAGQLPGAGLSGRVVISGYSQGGHGALWANEVAAGWAPELEVVGTFAGAPATEIDLIVNAARSANIGGFLLLIVSGYQAAYPEADPASLLTERGVGLLEDVEKGCTGELFAATAGLAPGDLVRADGPDQGPWKELTAANNPGRAATKGPVLIVHSDQDTTVPAALSEILHGRMCEVGQVVERRVLVGGGGHGPAAVPAVTQGVTWLKGLLDGTVEPVRNCPAA